MEDKHTLTPPNNGAESSPTNQSPESSRPRIQRERSPNSICAVCLGSRQNPCFSDGCLHEFCFECLRQWSQEKPECPLCKTRFRSIIHNIRSEDDYDVYELPPPENMCLNIVYIDFLVSGQWYRHSAMFRTNNTIERMQLYFLEGRIESPDDTPADILPQPSNPEHRVESNDSTSTQMPTSDSSIRNTSTASQRSNSFVSSPFMTMNSADRRLMMDRLHGDFPTASSVVNVSQEHPASSNPAEAEPMQRDEHFGSDDLAIMAYAEISRDATLQVFSLVSSDEEDDENALFTLIEEFMRSDTSSSHSDHDNGLSTSSSSQLSEESPICESKLSERKTAQRKRKSRKVARKLEYSSDSDSKKSVFNGENVEQQQTATALSSTSSSSSCSSNWINDEEMPSTSEELRCLGMTNDTDSNSHDRRETSLSKDNLSRDGSVLNKANGDSDAGHSTFGIENKNTRKRKINSSASLEEEDLLKSKRLKETTSSCD